jgi:uncharacterized surface protein with fasciclin (FAS1) repeats
MIGPVRHEQEEPMTIRFKAHLAVLATVAVAACAPQADTPAPTPVATAPAAAAPQLRSCIDTMAGMREFSQFVSAINATHIVQDFRQAREITIFAPTNDGLRRMGVPLRNRLFPADERGNRTADPVLAPAAIGAHVVQGRHDSAALARGAQYTTSAGTPLSTASANNVITVTGAGGVSARVTRADIPCSNGVIQAVDAPLLR